MLTRATSGPEAVKLVSVDRHYGTAEHPIVALDGVSLTVGAGTFTAVMGPSGSGKSTLLQVAAGLDAPTRGEVFVDGARMTDAGETELTKFRRRRIGFVRSEEHTSELQSPCNLVCRLLLEK